MSSAEAGAIVDLIAGVITTIEAIKTTYDAAKEAKGQLEEFRQVAVRLPLVIDILCSAEHRARALNGTEQQALEPIVESCKAKAESLNQIFQDVTRKYDDYRWRNRYKKALDTLGKGNKVECLMEGILKDIQVLVCERLKGIVIQAQVKEIEEAIKQMNEMPSSLLDESRAVQMPPVPDGADIDATWNYLRATIDRTMRSPENLDADMPKFMGVYTAVHKYCTFQEDWRVAYPHGVYFRGKDLYQCLAKYLTSYLEDLVKSIPDTGATILEFYVQEWDRYRASAKRTNHLLGYLNRHWVKRQMDEGSKDVFDVYTLHLVQWRDVAFARLHRDIVEEVLKMVERQRNGKTIEHGVIKSTVDSFVALGLSETEPTKSTLDIYRHHFEIPFLDATKKFYQRESKQFMAENGVAEYLKKAEAWLREEDRRVEMYLNSDTAEPLRRICNTAIIVDHETLLGEKFQSLIDNDQVDDIGRMYNLLSQIPGGLDSLPTKFGKGSGESGFDISDSGYASGAHRQGNTVSTFAESKLAGIVEAFEFQEHGSLGCQADAADPFNTGLYDKDTAYSPSETPSLPPLRSQTYIDDLASQLFRNVASQKPDRETLDRISRELPDLLRAFSLKIGHRATPTQCHVAYFLHKYRRHIQQSFEDMFPLEPVSKADTIDSSDTEGYKIARYFEGLDLALEPPEEEDSDYQFLLPAAADRASSVGSDHNSDTEDDIEPPEPYPYRDSVLNSPAFDWLVTTLLTEVSLTRQSADAMRSIRDQILSTLPSSHEVSRKRSSREYRATFEIDWDPLSFVKDQEYQESPDQAIERSITLTGSPEDAQALTTGQYLAQTWPTSGAEVMRIVAEVMRNTDHRASGTLPDGTELQARVEGGKFIVYATGIGDSLAEVAQQFAWLGSALRSSPFESGIAICSPAIRNPSLKNIPPHGKASGSEPYAEISCVIEFEIQEPLNGAQGGAGHCWHSMFRNPVMVRGYPIMAKHESGLGLEMPLNVMSGLAGSKYANEFDGKAFIKGFSAMLIATEVSKDLLLWHYYFNATGKRISYMDHNLETVGAISLQKLGAARHVVGWCRECDSCVGTANVRYGDIGSVYLPEPHADCILEKVSLSCGKLVSGGVTFAVGIQHIPPHLTRNSYLEKLAWIATRFVVFWDETDKRGWLVNGTSALLHLVRTSIQHHKSGDFSALVTFDPSKIKSPAELKPNSASKVLSSPQNLEVEVMLDKVEKIDEYEPMQDVNGAPMSIDRKQKVKRTYKLFCDVVEEHYRHLEQIMDYQVLAGGQNGVKIKLRLRKHLEGWDFMELAVGHDPSPRVATLEAFGWGWVDFVRSIEAITLIGSGFGEMICPTGFDGMCPNWKTLPAQKYYLAATVFDLENVIKTKKFGGSLEQPIKVVRDLLWHSPQETVAPCPCHSRPGSQGCLTSFTHHHDPVQVLYPTASKSILPIRGPEKLHSAGAIVFGHHISWRLRWKERGDEHVEQGEPPPLLAATDELDVTAVSAQSRASRDVAPAQVASSSSQSHESSLGVTRYASTSASASASTPIESATDSVALTASTSSEISSGTVTSVEQIPPDANPGREVQEMRQGEKKVGLFRKMMRRRKKSN